jgi:hypothetical protein
MLSLVPAALGRLLDSDIHSIQAKSPAELGRNHESMIR